MDIEAVVAVGLVTLALGALLFGASRLWLRSLVGRNVRTSSPRMTRAGIILAVAFVLLLFVGFGAAYFAPSSWFGQFVSRPSGRFTYAIALGLISIPAERWLRSRGVHLFSRDERRPEQ